MNSDTSIDLFRSCFELLTVLTAIRIIPGLIAGLIISIFQAATQINEQTLSFVPKLAVTFLAALFGGPWMLKLISHFTESLFMNLSDYIY